MALPRRRVVLVSGLALLSGCTFGENEQPPEETTFTETKQESTPPRTPESDTPDPDVRLQFGESYVDTDLEITVESPTLHTSFEHDGETYEMPEGDALVFTSIEFYNTHNDERRPIDAPIFTLVADGTTVLETHSVDHPEFDPSIRTRNIDDIPTTGRWASHGSGVEPGERRDDTAVFEVIEATDRAALSIVYESDRIHDDRFGDNVVEWSQ